ncbi:MAG: ABC transporter permease [Propionicimonas sp.]|nr:ABC transporter permease [Propionicimonas sp.]
MTTKTPHQTPSESAGSAASWLKSVVQSDRLLLIGVLLVILAVFSVLRPESFLTAYNFQSIGTDAAIVLVLAVGQTFVIVSAGIDLSIASVLVFSSVVSAEVMTAMGGTSGGWGAIVVGIVVAVVVGTLWGVVNGWLVAVTNIPALIVTLGTTGVALGLAQIITSGIDIPTVPTKLAEAIGYSKVLGIPSMVLIAAVVTVIGAFVLHQTQFGRYAYAIGSNEVAAKRVGINVTRHQVMIYALQGLLAGVASVMSLAQFSTTTIGGYGSLSLAVISGVILGGTSLFGGRGTIVGSLIGILIPTSLRNGLIIAGVTPFWETVLVGCVLILAVYIDQMRRRARRSA